MRRSDRAHEAGHTLIELMLALILLAVITAVALPRLVNPKAGPAASQIASDVQYAKELALRLHTICGIYIIDGTSYRVFENNDPNDAATDPLGGEDLEVTMSGFLSGVTLSHDIADGILKFDSLGTPLEGSAGNSLPAVRSITITSGGEIKTITVEPNTGKMSVS